MILDNGKYLLTIDDVLDNSELTQTDLDDVFGEKVEYYLKSLSQKTYRAMYSAYRGIHRERQKVWLNWYIQQDDDRQDIIRDAAIEYVRGAVYSGMDMQIYVGNGQAYSEEVVNILKENGLWILSTIMYLDEDIE